MQYTLALGFGFARQKGLLKLVLDVRAEGPLPRPQTWVDGELFDGVVTSASFKPSAGFFDELYTGGNGFLDGVPLISDSGPGDTDYNGGRWHLNILREEVDPDKYSEASNTDIHSVEFGSLRSTAWSACFDSSFLHSRMEPRSSLPTPRRS